MKAGVSYFSSRDLRHVRADLEEMAGIGCSYVVHCYTETDLSYYRETMAAIAAATRELEMEVWYDTWGLAGIFSGETFTRFPLEHPEARQVLSDGRCVGHGCPNHPATRAFLREWVDAAAAAGGDVIMWDEPHFYAGLFVRDLAPAWACYCETCSGIFRDRYGHQLPTEFSPNVKQFREDSLLDLLTEMTRYGHEKGMRNALCPVPTDLEAHGFAEPAQRLRSVVESSAPGTPSTTVDGLLHIGIGDFEQCASIPDLDVFGTDPYWYLFGVDPESFMRTYGGLAADACSKHGRELQIWLQAFRVPAGREEELRMGVKVAEDVGANYLAAWSFRATETRSQIACQDGEKVWRVIGEEFRRATGSKAQR